MDIYQHDSAAMFRFVLRGRLNGDQVQDLECAWTTAKSILAGKDLAVDISGLVDADRAGLDLLFRMRTSGARLTAALPPESEDLLRSLGVSAEARRERSDRAGFWQISCKTISGGDRNANAGAAAIHQSRGS